MTLLQTQEWAPDIQTMFLRRREHCPEKRLNWEGSCCISSEGCFHLSILLGRQAGFWPQACIEERYGCHSISNLYPAAITTGMLWLEWAEPSWETVSRLCGQSENGGGFWKFFVNRADVCEEECKALEKLPFGSRSIFQFCKAAPLRGLCSRMFFSRVDKWCWLARWETQKHSGWKDLGVPPNIFKILRMCT